MVDGSLSSMKHGAEGGTSQSRIFSMCWRRMVADCQELSAAWLTFCARGCMSGGDEVVGLSSLLSVVERGAPMVRETSVRARRVKIIIFG